LIFNHFITIEIRFSILPLKDLNSSNALNTHSVEILFVARSYKNVTLPFRYILFGDDRDVLCGVHRNVSTTSGFSRIWTIEHEREVSSPAYSMIPKINGDDAAKAYRMYSEAYCANAEVWTR